MAHDGSQIMPNLRDLKVFLDMYRRLLQPEEKLAALLIVKSWRLATNQSAASSAINSRTRAPRML